MPVANVIYWGTAPTSNTCADCHLRTEQYATSVPTTARPCLRTEMEGNMFHMPSTNIHAQIVARSSLFDKGWIDTLGNTNRPARSGQLVQLRRQEEEDPQRGKKDSSS